MVGTGIFRGDQQKDQIDRFMVKCFEINRFFQPRKQALQLLDLREFAMRNCNTAPGSNSLALGL